MTGMVRKDIERLLGHIEPQGVNLTRTKKGILLRMPDGRTEMVHWTGSDWRGERNLRASLHRSGITWPGEFREKIPVWMKAKPQEKSIVKVQAALRQLDSTSVMLKEIGEITHPGKDAGSYYQTTCRCLIALGWEPVYSKQGTTIRRWQMPPVIKVEDPAPEPEEAPPSQDAPAEPQAPVEREFLDTVDSWTVEIDTMPQEATLAAVKAIYASTGLNVELRVWKR